MNSTDLTIYLIRYSKTYSEYISWKNYMSLKEPVNYLYKMMPIYIGIPQAFLNMIVLATIVLIFQHPHLATHTDQSAALVIPRFHKAAFILIGNLALADLGMVLAEIIAVENESKMHQIAQSVYESKTFSAGQLLLNDIALRKYCLGQTLTWMFFFSASMNATFLLTVDR